MRFVGILAARVAAAEKLARSYPTADSRINLSLVYYQAGNFQGCINSANQALKLRPEDALSHWDEEIEAAQHALRINPGFQLAKNNLAWAISEKNKGKQVE
jgi:tetratricopeptide (TPR) repeat protein